MIDARDQIGAPVVTSCPTFVKHKGVTYQVAPDFGALHHADIRLPPAPEYRTRPYDRFTIFDHRVHSHVPSGAP